MFKSLDIQTKKHIIILDEEWNNSTIVKLREKSREKIIVCPVCQESVTVKAGAERKRRWHFAHKSLKACPLRNESPEILQARTLLYQWLKNKYPDSVTVEKNFPEYHLPRPVDCYIETESKQKIAYWVIDRGIRKRDLLVHAFNELGINVIWVFLSNMLKHSKTPPLVNLTPTEREFASPSDYNSIYFSDKYPSRNAALNYLDIENNSVTTLRGLWCKHKPQEYDFQKSLNDSLDSLQIHPKTGEFVHNGEHEKLLQHLEQERQRERLEKERKRKQQEQEQDQYREQQEKKRERRQTEQAQRTCRQQNFSRFKKHEEKVHSHI